MDLIVNGAGETDRGTDRHAVLLSCLWTAKKITAFVHCFKIKMCVLCNRVKQLVAGGRIVRLMNSWRHLTAGLMMMAMEPELMDFF